jgi:hypothetical protein
MVGSKSVVDESVIDIIFRETSKAIDKRRWELVWKRVMFRVQGMQLLWQQARILAVLFLGHFGQLVDIPRSTED